MYSPSLKFNQVVVQIIQFSLQKSYIIQKSFPLGHKKTKIIRERKRKKRGEKQTEKNLKKKHEKEINFLQKELKRSKKRWKISNNQN